MDKMEQPLFVKHKHLVIEEPRGAPGADEVLAVERELGAPLPAEYRAFLEVANGGTMDYTLRVPSPNGDAEELVLCDLFFCGRDDNGGYSYGTLLGELRVARATMPNIPRAVLPFARDGGDSMAYLDLSPEGAGRVVLFVQGLPAWAGGHAEVGSIEVAPSFEAYLDGLFLDDEAKADAIALLEDALHRQDEAQVAANLQFLDLALPGWRQQFPHLSQ